MSVYQEDLVLARELTAGDEKRRKCVASGRSAGTPAEPKEPDEEILFELAGFRLVDLVVSHQRRMEQVERFREGLLDLAVADFLRQILWRRRRFLARLIPGRLPVWCLHNQSLAGRLEDYNYPVKRFRADWQMALV